MQRACAHECAHFKKVLRLIRSARAARSLAALAALACSVIRCARALRVVLLSWFLAPILPAANVPASGLRRFFCRGANSFFAGALTGKKYLIVFRCFAGALTGKTPFKNRPLGRKKLFLSCPS